VKLAVRRRDLPLRSGSDNDLVHVDIGRLLDRERNGAGDRIRRNRELLPRLGELAASPPASAMRAARAARRSDPRAPRTTFAPRSASRSAVASPMPLLAPVITTTLPSVPDMKFSFPGPATVLSSWSRLRRAARDVETGQDRFRTRTARGGSVSASECGCPCHGVGAAQAPPALPRLLPPYSPASLLISSR